MADPTAPTEDARGKRSALPATATDATAATVEGRGAGADATDARAPTVDVDGDGERAHATAATVEVGAGVHATGDTALAGQQPVAAPLDLAVARAKTEAALFGQAEAVKVGRYRVIERAGAGGMGVVWSAWDPELGRGVALKLASSGDAAARARARDEGRALGRLSHPNVVPIYDVLEHDDGVFLVMELVKGKTLRAAAGDQSATQTVRAYRQAGEGLAAAHRAGLIHRDFKPDNAILGADGRVRVLDFGLAHEVSPDGEAETTAIAGTPRYMAPEQRTGQPLSAAVDQYALCVALRETLTARGGVPRWLAPILARGAAERPADRYPSMDDLLRALARDPATRWRRRAVVALAVVAVGAIGGAFVLGQARAAESPCEGGQALVDEGWGPARRRAVAGHLASLATPYAIDTGPRLVAALDDYATGWVQQHRGACRAHRGGEISATLHDRRAGCLSRRRAALTAVADLAAAASVAALPDLVVAVGELPDLAACADDAALLSPVEPPAPAAAPEAAAIADAIARIDVERDAGRFDDAARDAGLALARAEALGYRPLVSRARLARGRVALSASRGDRGAVDFAAATRDALVVGDEPVAIEAYARQAWVVGTGGDPSHATDGLALIEAVTERVGDRAPFARALLHHNVGSVALARGDRAAARQAFEQARREATAVAGSGAIELTSALSSLLVAIDDDPARRALVGDELIALRTRLLGASHPLTLTARILAAELLDDPAAVRGRLAPACADLIRYHPTLGIDVAECAYELTWLALVDDDRAAAVAHADAVIAAAPHGPDPNHVAAARAFRLLAAGDGPGAVAAIDALVAGLGRDAPSVWWTKLAIADATVGAALAHRASGDLAGAGRALTTADALYGEIAAAMPPPVIRRRQDAVARLRARR